MEAAQSFRLVEDRRQLQELDPAGRQLARRGVEGACGVARARRQRTEPAPQRHPSHDRAGGRLAGAPRRASTSSRTSGSQEGRTDTASPSRSARLRRPASGTARRRRARRCRRPSARQGHTAPGHARPARARAGRTPAGARPARTALPPLQPSPARSNAQTRVVADTFACTHAQFGVHSPRPLKRTTVGEPEPTQLR